MLDKKQNKIVILEENHARRDYLKSILSQTSDLAFCFEQVANCFDNLFHLNPDLIVVGTLPREDLIRFINAHSATSCNFPSVLITKDSVVKRYLKINNDRGIFTCDSERNLTRYKKSAHRESNFFPNMYAVEGSPLLVGTSLWVSEMKAKLPGMIRSNENILIHGEKGSGKESLARVIHLGEENYARGIFAKVSTSLLDPCTPNVQLLDNLRNAIVSVDMSNSSKKIRGVQATLFIDELNDIPTSLLQDILMFMESRAMKEGKEENIAIENLRLLVGTCMNTANIVSGENLRKNIFYRVNVLRIGVPPLRHRQEDIPFITDYFIYKYCKRYGKSYFELSERAKAAFLKYEWPGNIRELEAVVKRTVLSGENATFLKNVLPKEAHVDVGQSGMWFESLRFIEETIRRKEYLNHTGKMPMKKICGEFMVEVEKKVMRRALASTNWNRKKAASILNISYKSMLNKIKLYGLIS
jgi:DNA-binding NtrC family response regulator